MHIISFLQSHEKAGCTGRDLQAANYQVSKEVVHEHKFEDIAVMQI